MRKKTRTGSIAAAAALAVLASGCNPFTGPLPGNPAPATYFIHHLSGQGTWPLNLDLGDDPRDVYLTFVNPHGYDAWGSLTVSGSVMGEEPGEEPSAGGPSARIVPATDPSAARTAAAAAAGRRAPTPAFIAEYNQNPFQGRGRSAPPLRLLERSPAPPLLDVEGSSAGGTFYNMNLSSVPATCRKVVNGVSVAGGGTRTLNIWVADNCWYVGGTEGAQLVTQSMVDAIADKFLDDGSFNDIYDWVTAMLGAEWGPHGAADLVLPNGEITILLCDIANDNAAGGYVGYFWSKDNYTTEYVPESSERVMFTIDAVSYATGDGSWDAGDFWPEEIFSTLAHEFQHMIHFYQRGVLRDAMANGDTWINEMASLVTEDLVADKMEVIGPRGVDTELLYPDGSAGASGNTRAGSASSSTIPASRSRTGATISRATPSPTPSAPGWRGTTAGPGCSAGSCNAPPPAPPRSKTSSRRKPATGRASTGSFSAGARPCCSPARRTRRSATGTTAADSSTPP